MDGFSGRTIRAPGLVRLGGATARVGRRGTARLVDGGLLTGSLALGADRRRCSVGRVGAAGGACCRVGETALLRRIDVARVEAPATAGSLYCTTLRGGPILARTSGLGPSPGDRTITP